MNHLPLSLSSTWGKTHSDFPKNEKYFPLSLENTVITLLLKLNSKIKSLGELDI